MLDLTRDPDLAVTFCGVRSPNPFWLASAPPTNTEGQVRRAFEAGWGGAVWKTITTQPIRNVSSRYGSIDFEGRKVIGLNNIELVSDRSIEDNLAEIARIKREFPDRALFVSLMEESRRDSWHAIVKRTEDAGADGLELNFGCPHGMNERGMGSAVGQVPEYAARITGWVKEVARTPVVVKLTPNVADVTTAGRAVVEAGADALSLINTINSIMGVDLNTLAPIPSVAGLGTHGGYCGPAVKPIALNMVASLAGDPAINVPLSGIGGISSWSDAAEFILLGATTVQLCTAVMHHGFRIIDGLTSGLASWLRSHGAPNLAPLIARSVPRLRPWSELDPGYRVIASIDQSSCIHCGLCYASCEDGCHQAIRRDRVALADLGSGSTIERSGGYRILPGAGDGYLNRFEVDIDACVGCNMCSLVCPVPGCITMRDVTPT